jgi:hypothetical protein
VIEANTNITNLQRDVMLFNASISGTVHGVSATPSPRDHRGPTPPPPPPPGGLGGITVQLKNSDGVVVATTQTDRQGRYTFTQLSGPSANPDVASGDSAVRTYIVQLVLPTGAKQTSPVPRSIFFDSGDASMNDVDFVVLSPNSNSQTLLKTRKRR